MSDRRVLHRLARRLGRLVPVRRAQRPQTALTVALLGLAMLLVGSLAYQAYAAARSQRATVERTLRDYAAFANWEFSRHARADLLTSLITMFVAQMARIDADDLDRTLPPVEQFEHVARRRSAWCACLGGVRGFFRYEWRAGGRLTTSGEPFAPALQRWVRDTVTAYDESIARSGALLPTPFGQVDGHARRVRRRSVVFTNDSYAILLDTTPPGALLAFVISRDLHGAPLAAFGFVSDASAFLTPVLSEILRRERLLPPTLVDSVTVDSVVSVAVHEQTGRVLFRSPARFEGRFAAVDTLDARFGGLTVVTTLRPEVAPSLLVGGQPRSRLPMLLALTALAAGLMIVGLVQLRRQQELFRLRADFVSGVSHELRTPLAHIRLFAELLLSGKLRTDEERGRSARVIDQEARRLTHLVDNVLAFGRAERGARTITPAPLDVAREIEDVIEEFAPLAQAAEITIESSGVQHAVVLADRTALRQILINLLDNAVKYGPRGQRVLIGFARDGSTGRLWVDDGGPGIPPAARARAFEPFVRLEPDASRSVTGSGIGLAVVRELVEMHGGTVAIEDAPHGGARVTFTLRVAESFESAETAEWPVDDPAASAPR